MLAKANRLVEADDYKRLVRRGRRVSGPHTLVYFIDTGLNVPARLGFIVSKSVGVAVKRNLVRRRLKAITFLLLHTLKPGTEIVVRALPGSAQADWDILQKEISDATAGGMRQT